MELCDILFYLFAGLALLTSVLVVALRNPVSSAMCMAVSFAMTAAVLFGLGAHFLGIIQILVYAGAIMVLFLFIIMLLNVKKEEKGRRGWFICCVASCVAAAFAGMVTSVTLNLPGGRDCPVSCCAAKAQPEQNAYAGKLPKIDPAAYAAKHAEQFRKDSTVLKELKDGNFPDTTMLGQTLFGKYNYQFVLLGLILLVGTIGAVVLCRRPDRKD
ncbi:NADH-quinone oxidoreductase subunit J [Akkermansia glycaniphila]|uniref:NADH-quinone oxidoreductase subunit J family protein n=1 Tax=Akkermansia glycaniphila TaxID=1679444 RepID=UPI001C021C6F|nr:NADH-quinone oxidoreductase subunit J [Akkermansia glycaniphila]MBT9450035.1 NADH-quinone oxidoreductase subunit J [Akkermansia glycaniphila]